MTDTGVRLRWCKDRFKNLSVGYIAIMPTGHQAIMQQISKNTPFVVKEFRRNNTIPLTREGPKLKIRVLFQNLPNGERRHQIRFNLAEDFFFIRKSETGI